MSEYRTVSDTVVTDDINEKTSSGGVNCLSDLKVASGKVLRVDSITSKSYDEEDPVHFPRGIVCYDGVPAIGLYVNQIYEKDLGNGIQLTNDVLMSSDARIVGTLDVPSIYNSNDDDILVTPSAAKSLKIYASRYLKTDRIDSTSSGGVSFYDKIIASEADGIESAVIETTNINPIGANVNINGGLILPNNGSLSGYDVSVEILRPRNDVNNPILVMTNLEMNTGEKVVSDRVDVDTIGGRAGAAIELEDTVTLSSVANGDLVTPRASKILCLNQDDEVVYRTEDDLRSWRREFLEDFTLCFGVPGSSLSTVFLTMDKPWLLTYNSSTVSGELQALTDFSAVNSSMNGAITFNWTTPSSLTTRAYCMSNGFQFGAFYTSWTWEAQIRLTHTSNSFIDDQFMFVGLGRNLVNADSNLVGSDFGGACGFLYKKSSSTYWRMVQQGDSGTPTLTDTAVVASTNTIWFKMVGTKNGDNCDVDYYIADELVGSATAINMGLYNRPWGPRQVHAYNKTSDAIASGFGCVYDYVRVTLA